jgi:hypothetical protein
MRTAAAAWQAAGGSPGGADTQVQYNDGGAFAGSDDFLFDKVNLWTFGGASNDVNIVLGDHTAATLASGQHLLDFGTSVGGTVSAAAAVMIRFRGTGNISASQDAFGWDTAGGGRLFMRLSNTHGWYFTNETSPTYEWQTGTATWTDRVSNNGQMFLGFSTGVIAAYNLIGNARRFEFDANVGGAAASAASTFKIDGRNVFANFDEWELFANGTTSFMTLRSGGYISLYPTGINSARAQDEGVRLFPENYMRLTTAGFFAFIDVGNEDWTGVRFCRANSGTGTYYVYGAGINGNPLNVATDLAAGSSFYYLGADIVHSAGSGTVGFWEFRSNGTLISTMLLNGDILAGDYTGIANQDLVVTAGNRTTSGAGYLLTLVAGDANTSGVGGDVQLLPGSGVSGADGRVDFRLASNLVGAPGPGGSSTVVPDGYLRVKLNGTNYTFAYYLNV